MLTTDSFNLAALSAYRKAGFEEIGRRRQCSLLNGRFYDLVYMTAGERITSPLLGHIFVPDTPAPDADGASVRPCVRLH